MLWMYLEPLYTRAKGCDHVIVKVMDAHHIDMACWILHQAYFLEVGLMQNYGRSSILFLTCHVRMHVGFSFMIISLGP